MSEQHDFSRLDAYARTRQKIALPKCELETDARRLPVGAGRVIACVAQASPRFAYQVVEIPRIVTRDLSVNNPIPRDKPFDVPVPASLEAASPLAHNPAERRFVETPEWKGAIVRGRILREDGNGFDLATEDGGQTSFYPARLNAVGKVEDDEGMKDVVAPHSERPCCMSACADWGLSLHCRARGQAKFRSGKSRSSPREGRPSSETPGSNGVASDQQEGGGETARVDVVGPIPLEAHLDQFSQEGREHCRSRPWCALPHREYA